MTGATLSPDERGTFCRIADTLIPEALGMPAFSRSGADPDWLDRVLALRPELMDDLRAALASAAAAGDAETLNREDPAAIGVIGLVASSAYYMAPTVRALLAYPGQTHRPHTDDEEGDYRELLQAVIDRGPIYRAG